MPPPPPPTVPPPRPQLPGGPSPLRPVPSLLQALPAVQQQLQMQSPQQQGQQQQEQQQQQRYEDSTPPLSPSLFLGPLLASPAPGGAGFGGSGAGGGFAVPGAVPSVGATALSQLLRSAVWAPDWGAGGAAEQQQEEQQQQPGRAGEQQSTCQETQQDKRERNVVERPETSTAGLEVPQLVSPSQAPGADVETRAGWHSRTEGVQLGPAGEGKAGAIGGYRADAGPSSAAAAAGDKGMEVGYAGNGTLPRELEPALAAKPQHGLTCDAGDGRQQQQLQHQEQQGKEGQQAQRSGNGGQLQSNGTAKGDGGGHGAAAGQQRSDADELLDEIYASPFSPGGAQTGQRHSASRL